MMLTEIWVNSWKRAQFNAESELFIAGLPRVENGFQYFPQSSAKFSSENWRA